MILFFINKEIFDLVSKVADTILAVVSSNLGSFSIIILFQHNYSYIKITFSKPLIIKYP